VVANKFAFVQFAQKQLFLSFILAPIHTVVDAYTGWCGPCIALNGHFKAMKNSIGDDLLKFAVVKVGGTGFFASIPSQNTKQSVKAQCVHFPIFCDRVATGIENSLFLSYYQ
jgi:thiol-disulfide isomerase/thioredoxin